MRRRLLQRFWFGLYLWWKLPLAACAGLRLLRLDDEACAVCVPGGWRTRNPFRSTYFAALAMGAEMSTGAPALLLAEAAPASVALLVREVRGEFVKKASGAVTFRFDDVPGMATAVTRAAAGGDGEVFRARVPGRLADGTVVAEFDIVWTFKRRTPRAS
jgi:Domain of unknown function (DUF4442)